MNFVLSFIVKLILSTKKKIMEALMGLLAGLGVAFMIFVVLACIFMIVAYWFMYEKAGQPGWAAIIPIYNVLILLKVAGKPWWWIFAILLAIIPIVGTILILVWAVFVWHSISKNFGKEAGFTVGLVLLPIVFVPILAFGDAKYELVEAAPAPAPAAPVVEETQAPEAPAAEETPTE